MLGKNKLSVLALALFATSALSGCASLQDRFPFLRDKAAEAKLAEKAGRISVLASDNEIKADESLAGSYITIPEGLNLSEWPNIGGIASSAPQNLTGDGALAIDWHKKFGAGAKKSLGLIAPPVIGEGKMFILDGNLTIHAVDLSNNREIWSKSPSVEKTKGFFKKPSSALGGGIAYGENLVFASSGFGELMALNAQTGAIAWTLKTNSPIHSAPLAHNGKVYVVSVDNVLWAVDAKTGSTLWTQSSLPETARVKSASSSAIVNDTIISPFSSGEIIASLVANGRKLWSEGLTRAGSGTSLSSINDIAGRPVIAGGSVYAVSQSGIIAAIDLRTGIKIWEKDIASIQTPWVVGEYLYVVSTDSKLYCIKRSNGGVVWIKQFDAYKNDKKRKNRIVWTGPIMMASRLVMASSEGQILEIDPQNGDTLNKIKTKEEFYISPAYKDGVIYFYSQSGDIYALK